MNKVGEHPMAGKLWVGFDATTKLVRSEFDLKATLSPSRRPVTGENTANITGDLQCSVTKSVVKVGDEVG